MRWCEGKLVLRDTASNSPPDAMICRMIMTYRLDNHVGCGDSVNARLRPMISLQKIMTCEKFNLSEAERTRVTR